MSVNLEEIQDYIEGRLQGAALEAFLLRMDQESDLKDEIALRQEIQHVLEKENKSENDSKKLENLLLEKRDTFLASEYVIDNSYYTKKRPRVIKWLGGISLAAALVFILMLSGVFSNTNFGALPDMPEYNTRSAAAPPNFVKAAEAYRGKDYTNAISILSFLSLSQPKDAMLNYYLGLSYLGNRNWQAAKKPLLEIAEGNSIYNEDANYYLGYSFYKAEDFANAKLYLSKVSKENQLFGKAEKLLAKMN